MFAAILRRAAGLCGCAAVSDSLLTAAGTLPTPSARRRALAHPRPAAPARQATLRLIRPFPGPRRAPRRLPRAAISWCSGTTTPRTVRSQRPLVFRSIRPRGKASLVRCLGTSQGYQDALVLGVWEQVKDIKTLFML